MKSEEALLLVQKKRDLWRYQNERDEARRLQRSGSSKRMKKVADSMEWEASMWTLMVRATM